MARQFQLVPSKTYATESNVNKVVDKMYGDNPELRYFIAQTKEGRFFPVFVGQQAAQAGVHFHFNVVG